VTCAQQLMIYFKSILAGLAAFLVAVLTVIGASVVALFAANRLFETHQGTMSINAAIPLGVAVVVGVLAFAAGFRWEFRRAST
jgi:chromate transport protein ChrA